MFTQIVESVNDLAQIMKDLSVLVIDQVWDYEKSFGVNHFFPVLFLLDWLLHRYLNVKHVFFSGDSEPVYDQNLKQGTIVDRIDYNITNVASSVEQGVKELVKVSILFMLSSIDYILQVSILFKFLISAECVF